ncbi:ABC transporter substrate-binding protein [Paenibacillus allorhizosphaerae]|uniref:Extracellular solute-binding protein n=1 Tax=Paenibacillus allorhizosphaerae TaxID=2849866 RepID=A0ABN7THH4_9BACL|nr:ABC transporter substrate-binding protein [Paenibacillus allorhizosphaerae]CAG7625709.1 hypothetical protein PAECIP111802_01175 [Paenibacillus allorhizosphaerae]
MKLLKRMLVATTACLPFVLSSCGGTDINGVSNKDTAQESREPTELTIFYPFPADWPPDLFEKVFTQPIQQKFPHLTIKYIPAVKGSSIKELITAGQKVDIIYTSSGSTFGQLIDNDLQYDISPLIKKYNYDLNKLDPTVVDMARKLAGDKGIYGLPVLVLPSTMYYNKDIFDKFGVAYPKEGITWDELYELSKQLSRSDGQIQYVGLGASFGHMATLNQYSLPLVDPVTKTTTIDKDERWKSFVQNIVRFYQIPGVASVSKSWSEPHERNRFVKDRTVAMFLAQTALYTEEELSNMNWDFASYPVMADKPGIGAQAYPINFYITSQSEHKEQAFEVISYLTSEEFQSRNVKQGRFITALNDKSIRASFGKENPLYQGKNVKALQPQNYAPPAVPNQYNGMVGINSGIIDIINTGKDINTMLREVAEKANKSIADAEAAKSK